MPFFSLPFLVGKQERNWIHVLDRRTGMTYCGFTEAERMDWANPDCVHHLRNPMAARADCPDCLRKYLKMIGKVF